MFNRAVGLALPVRGRAVLSVALVRPHPSHAWGLGAVAESARMMGPAVSAIGCAKTRRLRCWRDLSRAAASLLNTVLCLKHLPNLFP